VLLRRGETYSVVEVVRGHTPKLKIMALKQRYGKSTLLIEESPISKGLIQSLSTEHRINVVAYKPDTDKRARLIAQLDLFERGSILLPAKAAWREEFIAEILAFPAAPNDDQVDALSQALAYGRNIPRMSWGYTPAISEAGANQHELRIGPGPALGCSLGRTRLQGFLRPSCASAISKDCCRRSRYRGNCPGVRRHRTSRSDDRSWTEVCVFDPQKAESLEFFKPKFASEKCPCGCPCRCSQIAQFMIRFGVGNIRGP
jgi:predicted phage terminase large subunit-like protein